MRDNYAQRVQATQDAIRASVRAGKRLEDCMRRQKRPRVNGGGGCFGVWELLETSRMSLEVILSSIKVENGLTSRG